MEKTFTKLRRSLGYENGIYKIIADHVENGSLLSVGCGQGKVERLLQDNLGIKVYGVEVTEYREKRIDSSLYDGKKFPFKDNSFDTVMFIYMLHHTTNIEELIREGIRVARKNIIILDHTYTNSISKVMLKGYDYIVNVPYRMPIPLNFLKIIEWKKMFDRNNLKIESSHIPTSMNIFFKLKIK